MADEHADHFVWLLAVADGLAERDAEVAFELGSAIPLEAGEDELIILYGATEVDWEFGYWLEVISREQVADYFSCRLVEDDSCRRFLGMVLDDEDHAFVKATVAQSWSGDQEVVAEAVFWDDIRWNEHAGGLKLGSNLQMRKGDLKNYSSMYLN